MNERVLDIAAAGAKRANGSKRVALALLIALVAGVAASAWARERGADFGGPGMFGGSPERAAHMVDHMLDGLAATDAQRSQIKQIVTATAADLKAQHEAARGLRAQGLALFMAPQVDAAAVEALRQQSLAQHDQMSKRLTQAMLDISAVLTPQQRVKLGERIGQRAKQWREHAPHHGGASAPTN